MTTHTITWTFEELGRNADKSLDVELSCYFCPGCPATYWEPAEPPSLEVCDVTIFEFSNEDSEVELHPSWQVVLKEIVYELAEQHMHHIEETLLERIGDEEEAAREDYYERKRDERRGC